MVRASCGLFWMHNFICCISWNICSGGRLATAWPSQEWRIKKPDISALGHLYLTTYDVPSVNKNLFLPCWWFPGLSLVLQQDHTETLLQAPERRSSYSINNWLLAVFRIRHFFLSPDSDRDKIRILRPILVRFLQNHIKILNIEDLLGNCVFSFWRVVKNLVATFG